MDLETRYFGRISYQQQEVIRVAAVGRGDSSTTPWLLLADKSHPDLYWLQSLEDPAEAIPLCSLAGVDWAAALRLVRQQGTDHWGNHTSLVALAEIREEAGTARLDLERPILIDAHAHYGVRLLTDEDHSLQYVPSEKVAPLRKCA